jgi:hypothetical protein
MIMSGTVTLRGRASIDDDLTATLSNLAATGDGMIGNLAAGLIQSKLQPHEGKRIPLMTFSLGEVTLRDLQITTTPTLHLSATFGRAT